MDLVNKIYENCFIYFSKRVQTSKQESHVLSSHKKSDWGPLFEQTEIPFTQGCFVPSLVEMCSVVLKEKIFKFRQCIFTTS